MRLGVLVMLLGLAASSVQADFKVAESRDKITLKDGKEIVGIIIASGRKGVLIVVEDQDGSREIVVPKDKVKSIDRGASSPGTKAFTTDPKDGVKVVSGEGFRDVSKPKKSGNGNKPKNNQGGKPAQKQTNAGRQSAAQITPQMINQLAGKDPRVKAFVNMVGGAGKAAQMLNDPEQRKRLEEMARRMKIQVPKVF